MPHHLQHQTAQDDRRHSCSADHEYQQDRADQQTRHRHQQGPRCFCRQPARKGRRADDMDAEIAATGGAGRAQHVIDAQHDLALVERPAGQRIAGQPRGLDQNAAAVGCDKTTGDTGFRDVAAQPCQLRRRRQFRIEAQRHDAGSEVASLDNVDIADFRRE